MKTNKRLDCPKCNGVGFLRWSENRHSIDCPTCHGVGSVAPPNSVEAIQIFDSKGRLYWVCPFLDKILAACDSLPMENKFEISRHCQAIAHIVDHLQSNSTVSQDVMISHVFKPYNFTAVIKQIKLFVRKNNLDETKIDEIVKLYL